MVPYLIFLLFIAGTGFLIWCGMTFHEDGLTFHVGFYFLLSVFCFGLAIIGTIKIILGDIS